MPDKRGLAPLHHLQATDTESEAGLDQPGGIVQTESGLDVLIGPDADPPLGAGGTTLEIRRAPLPGGSFVSSCVDVSASRAAEMALRESEERQKRALDASGLALWELDLASQRLYLSEQWSQMRGGPCVPTDTTLLRLLDLVPAFQHLELSDALSAAVRGDTDGYVVEHQVCRLDGQPFWIQSVGRVTRRDEAGKPLGLTGTNKDITQRKAAEDEIKQAREAAEAASRTKSEFLENVSHEIRTPLNGVMGMLRLLQDSPLGTQQRQYVDIAQSSALSLLALINDLLDISEVEAGRLKLEEAPFDLLGLITDLQTDYEIQARDKQLRLEVQVDTSVPRRVTGDAHRLRQVLNNLLSNALKFTNEGAVGLVVTAGPGTTINLTVHDTGIGIAADVQGRLFTRFTQADSSSTRQFGGTGLGLAIVQRLCILMGGRVVLDSAQGKGSSFRCELPLRAALDQERAAVAPGPDLLPLSQGLRLMVVEDNPTNRVVILGLLAQASPAEVIVACNGQEALPLADASVAAILMDCRMPVMDGFEATRQLRAAGYTRPIIALTASASAAERQRCLDAGMNDFLSKPVDPTLLIETLARWTTKGPDHSPASFDRARSLAQLGGNEQLLKGALAAFAQFTPALMHKLRTALLAGDGETVYIQLHSLKGSSGMVAAKEVSLLAAELEAAAQMKEWAQVNVHLPELERRVAQFLQESASP